MKLCSKIYDLLFNPLKRELGSVREIFISPDSNLNLIPFEILIRPDGKYLIEEYTFNYLAAGRDLLGFDSESRQSRKVLLIGDPDFDMGLEERSSVLRRLKLSGAEGGEIFKRSPEMRGLYFGRLPGTREEVQGIGRLLGEDRAEVYLGREAVEEVLGQGRPKRVVHLATHAFFLSDLEVGGVGEEMLRGGILGSFPANNVNSGFQSVKSVFHKKTEILLSNRFATIMSFCPSLLTSPIST